MPRFKKVLRRTLIDSLAILLILWGIFALLTPLTPGSWLAIIGLAMIFGRRKTEMETKKIVGKKFFIRYHLAKFFRRMPR